MQLLYLWINKYSCFEKANLNFCESPRFDFNEKTKQLKKIKNETNISLFPLKRNGLNEENCIDNISILVGSNGAGKTSICKFLYDLFFYHAKIQNFIVIYKIDGVKYITTDYDIKISELNMMDIKPVKLGNAPFNMVFYSPIYSHDHHFGTLSGGNTLFKDVSTTYTIKNDIIQYKNETSGIEYTDKISEVDAHDILDHKRYATFLSYFLKAESNIDLGITLSNYIYFSYDKNAFELFDQESNIDTIVSNIFNELFFNINKKNLKEKFIDTIALAEYCTFCRIYIFGNKTGQAEVFQKVFISILHEYDYKNKNITVSNKIMEIFGLFSETFELVEWVSFIHILRQVDETNFEDGYVRFDLTKEKEANNWIMLDYFYDRISSVYNFGEFHLIPTPSSGEYCELQIYSRLLEGISKIINDNDNKNFIIFLDESEITLHPKLQQHLIKNIINFLNELYIKQNYKFHIIFATHSPIILSDLPKDNVIFLKKEDEQTKSVVTNLAENRNTFAASIFELYKESFL